jgi:hypothetical protein
MLSQDERIDQAIKSVDPSYRTGGKKREQSTKDKAIGALLSLANEASFGALRSNKTVGEKLGRFEKLNPKLDTASRIGGMGANMALMGPIGKAAGGVAKTIAPKAMKAVGAFEKAHPVMSNVGRATGYGAAYRSGEQVGHHEPVTLRKNIASSIAPGVGAGLAGHAAESLIKGSRAAGKMKQFEKEIGPRNVSSLRRGEDILSEVTPETLHKIKGSALADQSGKSRAMLDRVKNRFEEGQARQVGQDISDVLGKGGAHEHIAKVLRRTQPKVDEGYWRLHHVTKPQEMPEMITSSPRFQSANRAVVAGNRGALKSRMPEIYANPESSRNLDVTKRRIQSQAGVPHQAPDVKRDLTKLSHEIGEHLTERFPKYPVLNKMAQLKPKMAEAHKLGQEAFGMPAHETGRLENAFNKNPLAPEKHLGTHSERIAARKGAIDYLQDNVRHSKAKHGDVAWKNIGNPDALKRIETMFGREKAKELGKRASKQVRKTENLHTLVGGSQTAANLSSANAAAKENISFPAALYNRPVQAAIGRGLWKTDKALKSASQFAPHTKIGLMVNPRRYQRYHKKLKGRKSLAFAGKAAKKMLRYPLAQKGGWKAIKKVLIGDDE